MVNNGHGEIKNPGSLRDAGVLTAVFGVFAAAGIGTFIMTLLQDPTRAWACFVQNHFYFLSLALGGVVFAAIQWLTGAMWSATVRRLFEAFSAYLPIATLTFIVLCFGIHDLYRWSHSDHVTGDAVLEGKASYLSVSFFVIRNLIALAIWMFFAKKMIGNSIAQDTNKSYALTLKNRALAPVFLILFAITFTMASFDQLMSLDPHWYSTMFGVYCFAGVLYMTLASTCLITLYIEKKGYLKGIFNENHLHDIGKFMFAFTIFWAYIGFSQFMLIWYANLPEETGYFIRRFSGGWFYVSLFLLIGKFVVPFLVMLPRDAKRNPALLFIVAIFMLIAQWIDVMWMVQPEFFPQGPVFGLSEAGITVGFLGLFGLCMVFFLSRFNVVAIGDPRLEESVHHFHQ